jgi:steroid delta-isomerase-like uncharacterized protein
VEFHDIIAEAGLFRILNITYIRGWIQLILGTIQSKQIIDLYSSNIFPLTGLRNQQNTFHTFNLWITAFKAHNISKMVLLLTEDVKIGSIAFGTHKGKVGASKYWQELYDAFPDIRINPITITTTAAAKHERIVAEIDISGTQRGKIGSSPPFGKKFHIRGAFVYEFAGNKIREIRMYYDFSVLRRQLNLLKI